MRDGTDAPRRVTERDSAPSPLALSRRTFLALGAAAAGALARSAWAGPGGERRGTSRREQDHVLQLRVPRLTRNGKKVPIVVEMAHPMTAAHHVTTVRVRNDGDPISSKGVFHLTPASGHVYLAFQARMHEGSSTVTATAECNLHGSCSASAPIEIPAGAGGCVASGPADIERTPGDDIRGPVIRIPELVTRDTIRPGELIHVQVKMRHPNRTGLVLRDGRFVQESEPLHLDTLEALYDGVPVSRFAMTSALSDDPLITFGLLAVREGRLKVIVTNSRGQRFEATHELRVA
jgi:desulfoferrodoxin (superoxide reductase-like protein)